jgi:hypothetical protein
MREMMFAQTNLPPIPWSTTGGFMLGLIGVLSVGGLFLWIFNQAKRAFGRTPPMDVELDKRDRALRKMIFASEQNMKERISRLEDMYAEMQADRIRKWEELQGELTQLGHDLAFIRGKFEREGKRP